ncbi:MAG TPA: hypothetical protein DCY13_15815, partial [Verrucomicrobiales bacterium]|nr:hypothetical protein [Verrucomicrobiales bacterium]
LLLQLADWLVERRQPAIVRRLGEESDGAARRRLVEECALMAPNAFLMLDGAEQLGWLSWRRLMGAARHLRGLLITVHVPGRLPTLYECSTSPALLRDLGESLAGSTQSACTVHDWEQLHRLHDGNLRDALRSCYQQLAG